MIEKNPKSFNFFWLDWIINPYQWIEDWYPWDLIDNQIQPEQPKKDYSESIQTMLKKDDSKWTKGRTSKYCMPFKRNNCCLIPICIIQVYWSGNTVDWIEDLIWLQSLKKIWIWLGFGFEKNMIGFEKNYWIGFWIFNNYGCQFLKTQNNYRVAKWWWWKSLLYSA